MYKPVLITANILNDFDANIEILPDLPNIETTEPVASIEEAAKPTETEYVAGKFLNVFGYTALCILFLIIIVLLIKKIKNVNEKSSTGNNSEENLYNSDYSYDENSNNNGSQDKNTTTLNTPNNINICIKKFLEKTIEN